MLRTHVRLNRPVEAGDVIATALYPQPLAHGLALAARDVELGPFCVVEGQLQPVGAGTLHRSDLPRLTRYER